MRSATRKGETALKPMASSVGKDKETERDRRKVPGVGVIVTIVVVVPVVLLLPRSGSLLFSFNSPPWGCKSNVTGVLTDLLIPLLYKSKLWPALYPSSAHLKESGSRSSREGGQ